MAYLQLDKELSEDKVQKIVAFLKALSDKNRTAIPDPENPPEEVAPK